MPHHRRRAMLVGAMLGLLSGGPAWAHAILIESTPPPNGTLPAGPVELRLRFNSRIDAGRSRVSLGASAQDSRVLPQADSGRPDMLLCRVDLAPGSYTLRWQVLAVDGHITRGTVPFTVTAAGGGGS